VRSAAVVAAAPYLVGLQAFGQSKALVMRALDVETLPPVGHFLAGMLTGAIVSFVEGPIDLFKSQVCGNDVRCTHRPSVHRPSH
jgi:hypothetical protein